VLPLLVRILGDATEKVAHAIGRLVFHKSFLSTEWAPSLLLQWIKSKASRRDKSHLLWRLKEHLESLVRYEETIFEIVEVVLRPRTETDATEGQWDVSEVVVLLLRLYERASGDTATTLRSRCLDAWDRLFELNPRLAWALTHGMEEST